MYVPHKVVLISTDQFSSQEFSMNGRLSLDRRNLTDAFVYKVPSKI